jgi:hypothetical protein
MRMIQRTQFSIYLKGSFCELLCLWFIFFPILFLFFFPFISNFSYNFLFHVSSDSGAACTTLCLTVSLF